MSNRIADDKKSSGFSDALRYIAHQSPASLSIATLAVVAIYFLSKVNEYMAMTATTTP